MMKSKMHAWTSMNLYKHNNQQRQGKWPKQSMIVKPGCSYTIGVKGRPRNNPIKLILVEEASCPFTGSHIIAKLKKICIINTV